MDSRSSCQALPGFWAGGAPGIVPKSGSEDGTHTHTHITLTCSAGSRKCSFSALPDVLGLSFGGFFQP